MRGTSLRACCLLTVIVLAPTAANWFLWNGGVIHVTMDGLTGGYSKLPLLAENYRMLDRRANGKLIDGLASAEGISGLTDDAVAGAFVVFRVELFVMAPLCLLTYIAYHRGWYTRP